MICFSPDWDDIFITAACVIISYLKKAETRYYFIHIYIMNSKKQNKALAALYPEFSGLKNKKQSRHVEELKELVVFVIDEASLPAELKDRVSKTTRWAIAMELLARIGNEWDADIEADSIRNWAATILELMYPGLILSSLRLSGAYRLRSIAIDEPTIRSALDIFPNATEPAVAPAEIENHTLKAHLGCTNSAHTEHGTATRCAYENDHLPPPCCSYYQVSELAVEKVAFSNISVFLFLLGKQATEANLSAFRINRPRALINKYNMMPDDLKIWNGDRQPTLSTLKAINGMWTLSPQFRAPLVTEIAYWTTDSHPSTGHEIAATTFRLLRWSGMGHVAMIKDLLIAWPEVREIPDLLPYVEVYLDSSRQMLAFPADTRPYAKIIAGDRLSIFRQQDIRPLTALAYRFVSDNNPTLSNYVHDPASDDKVNIWMRALLTLKGLSLPEETSGHEVAEE
jgi:hypothetical protein